MSEFSWGLMGYNPENPNNIGHEITTQIENSHERLQLERMPRWVLRSSGLMAPDGVTPHQTGELEQMAEFPDVVFVALPSSDDGEPAYSLIMQSLEKGATVITCEKGALANRFQDLKEASGNFERLGFNATVGGGAKPMEKAKADLRDPDNVKAIHMKPNATLNFISGRLSTDGQEPASPEVAVKEAIEKGLAEPGSHDILSVIHTEAEGDIPKKLAIFLNQSGLLEPNDYIDWHELAFKLTDKQIRTALENPDTHHFISSIYPTDRGEVPDVGRLGGFDVTHGRWRLVGGFIDPRKVQSMQALINLSGTDSCIVISLGPPDSSDGDYPIPGPGAGPGPTVNAMLDDFIHLVRNKKTI